MKQEFQESYNILFENGLNHFKNMQHVKLMSMKICSVKAFNNKLMSKIVQNKVSSNDAAEKKVQIDYGLKVVSIEETEQMEICDSHEKHERKMKISKGG